MMPRILLLLIALTLSACVSTMEPTPTVYTGHSFTDDLKAIAKGIGPGERVAVSWIYDEKSGDITQLGTRWRDLVESGLREHGVAVAARQEIGFIIDEAESFGPGRSEKAIWEQAGAEVIVSGKYGISYTGKGADRAPYLRLTLKALRVADLGLIRTIQWSERISPEMIRQTTVVRGNVFHKNLEQVVDDEGGGPNLNAGLDREPACYPAGSSAKVRVTSEVGVHLYLLNLAADNTVTLLYPNKVMPDQPLTAPTFIFPPPALADRLQMVFYPLQEDEFCHESIKVVASRESLDFSFLPVPVNQIYSGATGGDIKRMRQVLQQARGWSEKLLTYGVGRECE